MIHNEFIDLRKQIIESEFSRMNAMQKQAVFKSNGALLVLAGAGSGKTTVIVNRIANLIRHGDAYFSDRCLREPTQYDIDCMRTYLEGDTDIYSAFADLMQLDAPRPWQILAITFTNKAANELKERLAHMLGEQANDIWASTFHSACAKILRFDGERLGYSSHFTIYDTDDSKRVIKECQRQLEIDDRYISHKFLMREISSAKDRLQTPEDYASDAGRDDMRKRAAEVYALYQQKLKASDAMDFDDIIVNTVRLLESDTEIREKYQRKFRYVMVDEYQDTNHAQYVLTSLLAGGHGNICVVGDDDQSIYRFRGATIENILGFEAEYPGATVIRLEQNYRSTQNILDAANAVIANNEQRKGKNLWTANGEGEKIVLNTAYDEYTEARFVGDTVLDAVAAGAKFGDHAVLYRTNAQSNAVESALTRLGIPYRVIGGHRFYERKEIADAIAYLSVIANPADGVRLRRIINEPRRGIGDATVNTAADIAAVIGTNMYDVLKNAREYPKLSRAVQKLADFTAMMDSFIEKSQECSVSELLTLVLEQTGYIVSLESDPDSYVDRAANLNELVNNLKRYEEENDEPTLTGFLEEVALLTDIDNYNADADAMVLMTLHSAKGLEFPTVFIVGMEDGVFPGMQAIYSPSELEEERRLAYVGITRAKQRLYLTNAKTRQLYGATTHNRLSRFVEEIPSNLLERSGVRAFSQFEAQRAPAPKKPEPKKAVSFGSSVKKESKPLPDFKVGDSVRHRAFGEGVIISLTVLGNDIMLEVAFNTKGTKKLMAKFAGLEKI